MPKDFLPKALCLAAIATLGLSFWPAKDAAGEGTLALAMFDDGIEEQPDPGAGGQDSFEKAVDVVLGKLRAMSLVELVERYTDARDQTPTDEKSRRVQELLAGELKARALSSANPSEILDIGLMLHDDGFGVTEVLKKAAKEMSDADRYDEVSVTLPDGGIKKSRFPRPSYLRLCAILGHQEYIEPLDFDDYQRWEIAQWTPWAKKLVELKAEFGGSSFFSVERMQEIRVLEDACRRAGEELKAQHARDNFAINAREAFVRFKGANRAGMRNAVFSPRDLGREKESAGEVWDYTYWRPFVVYVETTPARDAEAVKAAHTAKAGLLRQLEQWFRTNLVLPFGLQRVLPADSSRDDPDSLVSRKPELKGMKFNTLGQLAEAEGWPLEIILLKDSATCEQICKDLGLDPGQRGHYHAPLRQVVSWDDSKASAGSEQDVRNTSALISAAFRMLADHYAAGPIGWAMERIAGKARWKPVESRPRFANMLLQDGLAEALAGFSRDGEGSETRYTFLQLNKPHLSLWQKENFESPLVNRQGLFRIKDLINCVTADQVVSLGLQRWKELGQQAQPQDGKLSSLYRACSAQAIYFFQHFTEDGRFKYRAKWWDYVKADFTGAIARADFTPDAGVSAFKIGFGIETDSDFDELEAEFVKFTNELKSE